MRKSYIILIVNGSLRILLESLTHVEESIHVYDETLGALCDSFADSRFSGGSVCLIAVFRSNDLVEIVWIFPKGALSLRSAPGGISAITVRN